MQNKEFYLQSTTKSKDQLSLPLEKIESSFYDNGEGYHVRPPFTRGDYEKFRQGDAMPRKPDDIMRACRNAYETVGLIRAALDLMIETAIQGFSISADNEASANFYKNWASRVDLEKKLEIFCSQFLVEGNVVCRRKMGKIDTPEIRKMRRSLSAAKDNIEPGMIPLDYVFYDPSTIELIGEELAVFSGEKSWGIKISAKSLNTLRGIIHSKDNSGIINRILSSIPKEIRDYLLNPGNKAIANTSSLIVPIPDDRIYVAHNSKQDGQIWAKGLIYGVLHYVIYNDKLRLAKLSALDAFHNFIRVWKLGDHKEGILPGAALTQLQNLLNNHPGGPHDVIWDTMIDVQELYPPVEQLANFQESNEEILLGLGIHSSLIGGAESTSSNASSAFIGLRNVMKRIAFTRQAAVRWINNEAEIIRRNTGLRDMPIIQFSVNDLFEQSSYLKLLVELADRDIISYDSVIKAVGFDPKFEQAQLEKEMDKRNMGVLPEKKGSFIQTILPESTKEHQKNMLKTQSDLQLKMAEKHAKIQKEQIAQQNKSGEKAKGKPGRPPGSRDSEQRQRKSMAMIKATRLIDSLGEMLDKDFLVYKNLDNKRNLTAEHKKELNNIKLTLIARQAITGKKVESCEDLESLLDQEVDLSLLSQFKHEAREALATCKTDEEKKLALSLVYSEFIND